MYINGINSTIERFADDTIVYGHIDSADNHIVKNDLNKLVAWSVLSADGV